MITPLLAFPVIYVLTYVTGLLYKESLRSDDCFKNNQSAREQGKSRTSAPIPEELNSGKRKNLEKNTPKEPRTPAPL